MAYATDTRAAGASIAQRLGELRSAIADRYAKYMVYRTTVIELASLSDRELADLGLHRSSIRDVALQAAYGN